MAKDSLKRMELFFQMAAVLKTTPYGWSKSSKLIVVAPSLLHRLHFRFSGIHNFLMSIYLLAVTIKESKKPKADDSTQLLLIMWLTYYTWSTVTSWNAFSKSREAIAMCKELIRLQREYEAMPAKFELARKSGFIDKFGWFNLYVLTILYILLSFGLSITLMFIMIPHKPQYLYSLIPQHHQSTLLFVLFSLYELYSKIGAGMLILTHTINLMLTSMISKLVLDTIDKDKIGWMDKIRGYRKTQVLVQYYNRSNTWLLLPWTIFSLGTGGLIFSLGTVRLYGSVGIFEYLIFPVCASGILFIITVMIYVPSFIHSSSESLLSSIEKMSLTTKQFKLFRKEFRCLRPFGIQMGIFPSVTKVSLLLLYMFLLNNFVSLLVTFPVV